MQLTFADAMVRGLPGQQAGGHAGSAGGGDRAKLSDEQREEVTARLNSYQTDYLLPPTVRIEQGAFWTVSDLKIALDVGMT